MKTISRILISFMIVIPVLSVTGCISTAEESIIESAGTIDMTSEETALSGETSSTSLEDLLQPRLLDVTDIINEQEFICMRDYIIEHGNMQMISNLFGELPVLNHPLQEGHDVTFEVYEANRLKPPVLQSDQIAIRDFNDPTGCQSYRLHYYPNGFDDTQTSSLEPYIPDYVNAHIYLAVVCDNDITDKQLMDQLSTYYWMLINE